MKEKNLEQSPMYCDRANDVYVVSKDGAKDLLIPAIHACIQNVDVAAGQMEVHLLPGLR